MHVNRQIGAGWRGTEAVEHRVDLSRHLARGLIARIGVLLESLQHDAIDFRRHFVVAGRWERPARLAHLFKNGDLAVASEETAAGEHLVEDRAEGEDVRSSVDRLPPG